MNLVNGMGAVTGKSGFDPLDLGRPPSAARALAEQTEQRAIRDLQERFDRLLPPAVRAAPAQSIFEWRADGAAMPEPIRP